MAEEPVYPQDGAKIRYLVLQPETAERLHLQGFVQFLERQRLPGAKRQLHSEVRCPHLETRRGTAVEAADYCKKEDSYTQDEELPRTERGDLQTAGRRVDLEDLAQAISERTSSLQDIASEAPAQFVRYHRGLSALADIVRQPYAQGEKNVKVYYGPTGTGKTRKAFEDNPDAYFWGPEQGKWFQGYSGQETTILDEYRGQLPFGFLLRLTDRYPMKIEFKDSSTEFVSPNIIICSPVHPLLWYPSLAASDGKMDQLMRRVSSCTWFGEGPEPPIPHPVPVVFQQF